MGGGGGVEGGGGGGQTVIFEFLKNQINSKKQKKLNWTLTSPYFWYYHNLSFHILSYFN